MKKRKIYLFLILLLSVFCIGCQKGDTSGETIILLGKETYVQPFKNFVPDSLYSIFDTLFVTHRAHTHEGFIPPNIEGVYVIDPKILCYSNYCDTIHSHEAYFEITNQHNRIACINLLDGGSVITDSVFIMGNDEYFTLYYTEYKVIPNANVYPYLIRNIFIAGKKTDEGIHDVMYGTIIMGVPNIQPLYFNNFVPGNYFIYTDPDGVAANSTWPAGH